MTLFFSWPMAVRAPDRVPLVCTTLAVRGVGCWPAWQRQTRSRRKRAGRQTGKQTSKQAGKHIALRMHFYVFAGNINNNF